MSFTERLTRLLKEKNLSANELSKIIEVQRSTLSHLINGRNKPSLDLIERFYTAFPDIRLEWLIMGKGSMYLPIEEAPRQTVMEIPEMKVEELPVIQDSQPTQQLPEHLPDPESIEPESTQLKQVPTAKRAVKTIIFFEDNSFEIYHNSQM